MGPFRQRRTTLGSIFALLLAFRALCGEATAADGAAFDPPIKETLESAGSGCDLRETAKGWGPAAVPALIDYYRGVNRSSLRTRAIQCLGAIGTPEAEEFLVEELERYVAQPRGAYNELPALHTIFADGHNPKAMSLTLRCFRQFAANAAEMDEWWAEEKRTLLLIVARVDIESVVREALANPDASFRSTCAWAVGMMDSQEAVDALERMLEESTDEQVKEWATCFLGGIPPRLRAREVMADTPGPLSVPLPNPAGEKVSAAARIGAVNAESAPGQDLGREEKSGTPAPGSADALWHEWRYEKDLEDSSPPDEAVKRQLAPYLEAEWRSAPPLSAQAYSEIRRLSMLTTLIGTKAILPILERHISTSSSAHAYFWTDYESINPLTTIGGDDVVDFCVSIASNQAIPYGVRCMGVVGLGQIGTPRSVDAFRRLRDAAYGLPGAPARKPSYTHAERMAEAVEMTYKVITGPVPRWIQKTEARLDGAAVSEDYETGDVSFDPDEKGMGIILQRFGNEWLPVGIRPGC